MFSPNLSQSNTFYFLPGKNQQTPTQQKINGGKVRKNEKKNKAIVTERVVPNPIAPTELEIANLEHSEQILLKILLIC